MEVYLPWGLYSAAIGAAFLHLEALPLTFAALRLRSSRALGERLWWLGLICLGALAVWPIWAAGHIDWPGRAPSFITVVLMTLGCGVLGFLLARVVGAIVGAWLSTATAESPAAFLRTFNTGVVLSLLSLTTASWWTLWPNVQDCLSSSYC